MITGNENNLNLSWGNNVLSARWTYIFNNKLFADFTAYGNLYRMGIHSVTETRRNPNLARLRSGASATTPPESLTRVSRRISTTPLQPTI